MTTNTIESFREVWLVDFEFGCKDGDIPDPVCLVAKKLGSDVAFRLWEDEMKQLKSPPYDIGSNSLFVAYYASAEIGCHLVLDWPLPTHVLDLFTEFRNLTNGRTLTSGAGLLGALVYFGLPAITSENKDEMRDLALRGGPWSAEEQKVLLEYCETDVDALELLLSEMECFIDLPRALLRGRYMKAAAKIENTGIPLDTTAHNLFKDNWESIQDSLILEIDSCFGVYEGRTFKRDRFEAWLTQNDIPWPRLESGRLNLSDDAFREMAKSHSEISSLRELRTTLSKMRLSEIAVGEDGRNRCLLSAFRSKTGRNQPSNSKFIFGPSVWLRSLIRPQPGFGLAYLDWSQQEFGIAAALSNDPLMMEAYSSGDPYLAFAKQAGAVPENATKANHGQERSLFKACVLAVQYGMGAKSLGMRIGQSESHARELLRLHRETYKVFWEWSDAATDCAMINGKLWTVFGWNIYVGGRVNPRSLQNFPMQANGAEMLRLACCLVVEAEIRLCAPIHDAILIEAPLKDLDECVVRAQELMAEASKIILDGFKLRSDAEVIRFPNRYMDERGEIMWNTVWKILNKIEDQ
jgi:DNA polymerase I